MKWERIKKLLKRDGVQLSLFCIIYGLWNLANPHIINGAKTYDLLKAITNAETIGIIFIVAGIIKIYGHAKSRKLCKRVGIVIIAFMWSMVLASMIYNHSTSTPVLFTSLMIMWSIKSAITTNY